MLQKSKSLVWAGVFTVLVCMSWSCSTVEDNQPVVDIDSDLMTIPAVLKSMEDGIDEDVDFSARKNKTTFATFNAALGSTGLASVFAKNDLTVFAPTDEAFAKLGLNPGNIRRAENLTNILLYHVVAGSVLSFDLSEGFVPTLNGAAVEISLADGAKVNEANIILVDKKARNGVIHGIDEVLLPPTQNIVEIALGNSDFSILVEAVVAAGYVDLLASTDNLTVFAPTNDAFSGLLTDLGFNTLEELIDEEDGIGLLGLQQVLAYHVFAGRVYSSDLSNTSIEMFSGDELTIDLSGPVLIDARGRDAGIIATDIQATNGVIHVIDKVILPF